MLLAYSLWQSKLSKLDSLRVGKERVISASVKAMIRVAHLWTEFLRQVSLLPDYSKGCPSPSRVVQVKEPTWGSGR